MKYYLLIIMLFGKITPSFSGEWQENIYENNYFNLPYQIYIPDNEKENNPLVIFLHGTGVSGNDNKAQLHKGQNIGSDYFASKRIQNIRNAYVLAPQTTKEIRWASTDIGEYDLDNTEVTPSMKALLQLIDNVVVTRKIDTTRIYLVGLSRGGQGVWNAALLRPNYFAAIVPIAGSSSPKHAAKLAQQPTWAFHGTNDIVTHVNYTRNMVDAMLKNGSSTKWLRYTEIQDGTHPDSWIHAFKDQNLWYWMLEQQRTNIANE
ncbi:TPA: dienelactone hydrolase family protein [Providencia rettgeri]|uniref:carboxylesterase family protein n=1 Tax=Providencia manganoxydans TaxID=2923283 RepID=UPI00280FECE0|nr:dienelactone hydrolase family protein [Providencia rettgeri]HEC8324316.1 dienelactone hydrolase family protein [Providencia rettgeri]